MHERPDIPAAEADSTPKSDRAELGTHGGSVRPIGAILVTSTLALIIVLFWFGMYLLDFVRS